MTAIPVAVAEAIAEEIRAGTFTLSPDVRRGYVQDRDLLLAAASELRIDVQVGDVETEAVTRAEMAYVCQTDIALRKRFVEAESDSDSGHVDTAEIDRLILLMQQIHDHFSRDEDNNPGRRLTAYEAATWEGVTFQPLYYPKHLRLNRQFTGIVQVTYKVIT